MGLSSNELRQLQQRAWKMIVLVVDDSSSIRRILRKELEDRSHRVVEAESGSMALEVLEETRVDAISMDVDMPGLSGYDTCLKLRKGDAKCVEMNPELARLPIVFLTANDTDKARYEAFKAGANGFVIKPFIQGELTAEIERATKRVDDLAGHQVLVVDDSVTTRKLLKLSLEEMGLNVLEAKDGRSGYEFIKGRHEEIDLVIADNFMPEMSGDEMCMKVRSDLGLQELPIIFLSSISDKKFIVRTYELGASDFLLKPFHKEEVQARVRFHLKSKLNRDSSRRKIVDLKREHKIKDQFLSICSHDLRSPLTGVVGFTDIMLEDEETSEEHREYLSHIKSSSEFLLSIINDILDLGRLQSESAELVFSVVDLSDSLESCIGTLRHMASPKHIELKVENRLSPSTSPDVLGDANSLKRLFNNLISNSIKFSHEWSEVTIALERGTEGGVRVLVQDRGIGIPEDKLPLLFAGDNRISQKGTKGEESFGFGMKIVKEIAEQHGGRIAAESKQGEGTTITVEFPDPIAEDLAAL